MMYLWEKGGTGEPGNREIGKQGNGKTGQPDNRTFSKYSICIIDWPGLVIEF